MGPVGVCASGIGRTAGGHATQVQYTWVSSAATWNGPWLLRMWSQFPSTPKMPSGHSPVQAR